MKRLLKIFLVFICLFLSIKILSASEELETDVAEYKRICCDSYALRWEKLNIQDSSGYTFPETPQQQFSVSKFFFHSLISRNNYIEAFKLPSTYKECPKSGYNPYADSTSCMPETTVSDVTHEIITYINYIPAKAGSMIVRLQSRLKA